MSSPKSVAVFVCDNLDESEREVVSEKRWSEIKTNLYDKARALARAQEEYEDAQSLVRASSETRTKAHADHVTYNRQAADAFVRATRIVKGGRDF